MVTQLARLADAYVIRTGRAADRQKALDFGAQEFVDLDNDALEDVGGVDLVFDVIGGDTQKRAAAHRRPPARARRCQNNSQNPIKFVINSDLSPAWSLDNGGCDEVGANSSCFSGLGTTPERVQRVGGLNEIPHRILAHQLLALS
jgi:NADPH:quinone reductase-like Zn-dependent oxidoreductase